VIEGGGQVIEIVALSICDLTGLMARELKRCHNSMFGLSTDFHVRLLSTGEK
jgi:hypothetical protein